MLRVCVVVQTVPRALRRRWHRRVLLLSRHLSVEVLHWHTWVDPLIVSCAGGGGPLQPPPPALQLPALRKSPSPLASGAAQSAPTLTSRRALTKKRIE